MAALFNFLPMEWLELRMANPKKFEEVLVNYINASGAKVTNYKTIGDIVVYHQLPVVAAGVYKFFQGVPSAASSNMTGNGFQRSQSEHMVITAIKVLTGNNATIQSTDWTNGAGLPQIKNGAFDLIVNGVTQLRALPCNKANEDVTDSTQGLIGLSLPPVWPGQTDLNINLTTLAAGAANDNCRFELHGFGLLS